MRRPIPRGRRRLLPKGPGRDVRVFISELGACEGDVLSELSLCSSVNGHRPGSGWRLQEARAASAPR